jgi:hypothetical protein
VAATFAAPGTCGQHAQLLRDAHVLDWICYLLFCCFLVIVTKDPKTLDYAAKVRVRIESVGLVTLPKCLAHYSVGRARPTSRKKCPRLQFHQCYPLHAIPVAPRRAR